MAQVDIVYDFLKQNYRENEPIFLSEIRVPGIKDVLVRQQMKKLLDAGRIKRFDTGIYYFPKESVFASGTTPSIEDVIRKKYLMDGDRKCGYIGGIMFANRLGITTQMPAVYEIYTNKATTEYREVKMANIRIILRKPNVEVNDDNASTLQFLDLLKEITEVSELKGDELTDRLIAYMKQMNIEVEGMDRYLPYYPERIYRNMYEVRLFNVVSA